jgi:hypothetical protein
MPRPQSRLPKPRLQKRQHLRQLLRQHLHLPEEEVVQPKPPPPLLPNKTIFFSPFFNLP